uniref:Uncharacterized protein n=1 Tax=Rhizophora mucronata TaxID=61149 RepID=A0A2P2PEM8_RHIMU
MLRIQSQCSTIFLHSFDLKRQKSLKLNLIQR